MVEDDDIAESSEEEIMYSEMVRQQQRDSGATKEKSPAKKLIETNTDTVKWTAELERVSAKLTKLSRFVISDAEWRTHLATSSSNSSVVRSVYPKAEVALKSIRESMQATIERVVSKENFINSKFDNMQYQFRELQQKLQETQKQYQTTQESVQDLSETLSTISSRLEELKELQDSKGSSMTDTAPLVRMKKALKKLREEMKQMEIRIGVLSHTLMQANMAESANGNGFRAAGDDDELGLESKRPGDRGHTYTDDDTDNDLSLKLAGETSASMWQPAQPLFITLMAICIGIESPTVLKFIGIFIAAGGCMFVSLWDPKADGGTNELAGNTLFFVQSLCCATFYVSEKPLLQKYDPVATVGVAYIIATFFMAATAVVVNNVHSALHFFCEDCGDSGWTIPTDAWWAIAYWIFGGSIAGYLLNTWGNKRVDASIVGIYAVIQPVVTVACASIVIALSSAPHWGLDGLSFADIGAIGIILGLLIVVCDNIRRRRSVATSGKHHRLLGEALLDVESSVAE
eukprot:g2929.t1